jgi:exosortase D (VPLPA-CTERM-specific)
MVAISLRRSDWRNLGAWLALIVCAVAIEAVWRSLEPLFSTWETPEYSHAWFILPLAILIFVRRLRAIEPGRGQAPGVVAALLSVLMLLFAWATGSYTAMIDGAILGLIGFVWASVGSRAMRALAAPLLYLFLMVPLPLAFYLSASAEMQLLASQLGIGLISLAGIKADLDGNIIILASARLEVAQACSGLRYLFPLIGFACLVAMLMEDRLWKKAVIVISSVPIAILLNAGRIALIAILLERWSIDTTSGSAHAVEGFAVFLGCMILLSLEVWGLLRIGLRRGRFASPELFAWDHHTWQRTWQRLASWPVSRASGVAAALLVIGGSLVAHLPARSELVPERQPLALFPMEFKDWRGVPATLDSDSLGALGLTDYLLANYSATAGDGDGDPVNLYIAYYASQRDGLHAHSPRLCIPGGGWSILAQSIVALPDGAGGAIEANRVVIEKQHLRQIVYYWFEERGRHIAKESSLKYYALRDALLARRSDGALVRVSVPVYGGDAAAADRRAMKLVADSAPLLASYVPGRAALADLP